MPTLYDRLVFVCRSFGARTDGRFGHSIYTLPITAGLTARYHTAGCVSIAGPRCGEIWHQRSSIVPAIGGTWWARLLVPEGVEI